VFREKIEKEFSVPLEEQEALTDLRSCCGEPIGVDGA
jgi:hypothetical protein